MQTIFDSKLWKCLVIASTLVLLGFLVFDELDTTIFGALLWKIILGCYFVEDMLKSASELVKPND